MLRKAADDLFGARSKINRERKLLLEEDVEFKADIEKIRKAEHIPRLNTRSDFQTAIFEHDSDPELMTFSYYLDYLGKNKKLRIRRAVRDILLRYKLPLNFHDWVLHYLLYGHFQSGTPRYNWNLLQQVIDNPEEAERIGLTTKEKRFWLQWYRFVRKIKNGRIPEKYAKEYKMLLAAFSRSKNNFRRSRKFDDSLLVMDEKNSSIKVITEAGTANKRKTYRDVVAQLTHIDDEDQTSKEAAKYRKNISRLKKRGKKFKE